MNLKLLYKIAITAIPDTNQQNYASWMIFHRLP